VQSQTGRPYDVGFSPLSVEPNHFAHKSLSSWAVNIAVGCSHACRFCYVPSVSTLKQKPSLEKFQVADPDAQWGDYVILRPWDEEVFRKSVQRAERIPRAKLNKDGNRAVIYCSTTDAYQVFPAAAGEKRKLLEQAARHMVRRSLEIIRDESTLNVRILTRSPMAVPDFDLFKTFGKRLVFGMSLPTLNDRLLKIYEPRAPGPDVRLKALQKAREAGLHVYVAVAPTYPDCDEADLRATLTAVRDLNPITVFHEPINLRAQNVERIEAHARDLKVSVDTAPLKRRESWCKYAVDQLILVERIAEELGLIDVLKLWPDSQLGNAKAFVKAGEYRHRQAAGVRREGRHAVQLRARQFEQQFSKFEKWLHFWWNRVSAWPT